MPGIYGSAANWAHFANSVPSMLGVVGTLGTADTTGTALTVPVGVDPLTGAEYVMIVGTSGGGTSQIAINGGTIQLGTVTSNSATGVGIPANAFYVGVRDGNNNLAGLQTSSSGGDNFNNSLCVQPYVFDGAQGQRLRTAPVLTNTVGTTGLLGVGVLGQDSGGTYHQLAVTTGGSIGTLLTTSAAGTFTLSSKPGSQILSYGTFGAGTIGTLIAAPGVGTSIYVCSYVLDGDVTALGTPDIVLSFGTVQSGAGVIVRAGLPTTTPLSQSFSFPVSANLTNTPLTFMQLSGGGTMSWNITYFVQ